MYYSLEYDRGYVVTTTRYWEDGSYSVKPLRKFKFQGDALIFKYVDCQLLTDLQVKSLVKSYKSDKLYKRINSHCFRLVD